jgi:Protein of unknown function (DUF3800)
MCAQSQVFLNISQVRLPSSALGKMLPCAGDAERGTLIALKSYFDGSYRGVDWNDCECIGMGGFAADDGIMAEFEIGWAAMLADSRFRPAAPYLHMKELRSDSRKSPFAACKGWDNTRRKRLVSDVVEYLQSLDQSRSRMFLSSVDARAVQRRIESGLNTKSPIRFCTHFCPHYVMAWFARDFPSLIVSEAHFYFDRDEPFFDDFRALRRQMESDRFEIAGNRETWQLIKSVTETDSKRSPALQVADLLAWGAVRQYTAPKGAFLQDIAVIVKRVLPASWTHWNDSNLHEAIVP